MTDQLLIGEMVCRIITELGFMPEIKSMWPGRLFVHFEFSQTLIFITDTSLEGLLAECYNQMKETVERG